MMATMADGEERKQASTASDNLTIPCALTRHIPPTLRCNPLHCIPLQCTRDTLLPDETMNNTNSGSSPYGSGGSHGNNNSYLNTSQGNSYGGEREELAHAVGGTQSYPHHGQQQQQQQQQQQFYQHHQQHPPPQQSWLLPNWQMLTEHSTGRHYYFNSITSETTWEAPINRTATPAEVNTQPPPYRHPYQQQQQPAYSQPATSTSGYQHHAPMPHGNSHAQKHQQQQQQQHNQAPSVSLQPSLHSSYPNSTSRTPPSTALPTTEAAAVAAAPTATSSAPMFTPAPLAAIPHASSAPPLMPVSLVHKARNACNRLAAWPQGDSQRAMQAEVQSLTAGQVADLCYLQKRQNDEPYDAIRPFAMTTMNRPPIEPGRIDQRMVQLEQELAM